MGSAAGRARLVPVLAFLVVCAWLASPAHAQSIEPSSAVLEAPAVGESAATVLTVEVDGNILGVGLCLSTCDREIGSISLQGALQDGSSRWILDGSDCLGAAGTCKVSVTYEAGDAFVHEAELFAAVRYGPELGIVEVLTAPLIGTAREAEPGEPQFAPSAYRVDEGGTIEVEVLRVGGSDGRLEARWYVEDPAYLDRPGSEIASADDYRVLAPSSDTLVWEEGDDTPRTITLAATRDSLAEQTEFVALAVESYDDCCEDSSEYYSYDATEVAIVDVPYRTGRARFVRSAYEVVEGESIDVRVERVEGADGELSVGWFVAAGGTAGADDYRLVPESGGTLIWADGDVRPQTITVVATLDEVVDEPPETLGLRLSRGEEECCETEPDDGSAVVTIVDATDPPSAGTVQFARVAASVEESAGSVALTLTRTDGADGTVVVDYRLVDGTATFGVDYGSVEAGPTGRVRWADDDAEPKTIVVPVAEDLVREPTDETFTVALSLPPADPDDTGPRPTLGPAAVATVSIVDTTPPPDTVALARVSVTVEEGAGAIDVVVRRLGGGTGAASVGYRLVAGSASAGGDFTAGSGRLSWAAGDTADRSVGVPIVDDRLPEPDETFSLVLDAPINASVGEPGAIEITVTDDDPPGTLEFDAARYAAEERDGEVTLRVSRAGGTAGAAAVRWAAADGTARAGEDYARSADTAREGTLEWAAGEGGVRTITFDLAADELVEGEESFAVTLSGASGAALGQTREATVLIGDSTVIEDDRLSFAAAETRVGEGAGSVRLAVRRDGRGAGRASVRYRLEAGTASLETDLAPGTPTEGVLEWAAGTTGERFIEIALVDDELVEEEERFTLALGDPVNAALGSPASTEVVIVDDDVETFAPGRLRFTSGDLSVAESEGRVTFGVERVDGTDGEVSVRYETVDAGAEAGRDYTAASGTLVWAEGVAGTRTVTVDIAADAEVEDDERFLVQLREAVDERGEELPIEVAEIAVTIGDDTSPGTFAVLDAGVVVSESAGEAVVRVARTGGADGAMRVRYESAAGSALAGEDFTPVEGVLEWNAGESGEREVRVPIVNDPIGEPDETFTLLFAELSEDGAERSVVGEAVVTIDDDDPFGERDLYRLVIVAGDGQSGLPGDVLEPMLAEVLDTTAGDAVAPAVPVRWTVNPAGSAELLEGDRTVSDEVGIVRNRVRVLSRGFLNIVASVESPGVADGERPPPGPTPVTTGPGEAVFVVRAGLFAAPGLSGNQAATGGALDAACETLSAAPGSGEGLDAEQRDLLETCAELETRLGDGRLPAALDRLAPEELFAIADSVIDTTDIQVTNVYARINAIRGRRRDADAERLDVGGLGLRLYGEHIPGFVVDAAKNAWTGGGAAADADRFGPRLGVFVSGTVSVGEVDSGGDQADADVSSSGLTIGADYRFSDTAVAGIGLGIVVNETEFTPDEGRVDADGIALTLFGTWYEDESGYLDGVLDIGRNTYDVRRRINLPGLPEQFGVGETEADVLSLTLGAGRDTAFGAYELGPYARATHTRATVDGYSERAVGSETGRGSVLDIGAHDIRSTRLAIGLQLSRSIGTRRGVLVPQFRVETQFEFDERKKGIEARFRHDPSGTPFTVNGDIRDNGYLNIGLGASAVLAGGRSGYLFYETRAAHDYVTQHWVKAGVRLEF